MANAFERWFRNKFDVPLDYDRREALEFILTLYDRAQASDKSRTSFNLFDVEKEFFKWDLTKSANLKTAESRLLQICKIRGLQDMIGECWPKTPICVINPNASLGDICKKVCTYPMFLYRKFDKEFIEAVVDFAKCNKDNPLSVLECLTAFILAHTDADDSNNLESLNYIGAIYAWFYGRAVLPPAYSKIDDHFGKGGDYRRIIGLGREDFLYDGRWYWKNDRSGEGHAQVQQILNARPTYYIGCWGGIFSLRTLAENLSKEDIDQLVNMALTDYGCIARFIDLAKQLSTYEEDTALFMYYILLEQILSGCIWNSSMMRSAVTTDNSKVLCNLKRIRDVIMTCIILKSGLPTNMNMDFVFRQEASTEEEKALLMARSNLSVRALLNYFSIEDISGTVITD